MYMYMYMYIYIYDMCIYYIETYFKPTVPLPFLLQTFSSGTSLRLATRLDSQRDTRGHQIYNVSSMAGRHGLPISKDHNMDK